MKKIIFFILYLCLIFGLYILLLLSNYVGCYVIMGDHNSILVTGKDIFSVNLWESTYNNLPYKAITSMRPIGLLGWVYSVLYSLLASCIFLFLFFITEKFAKPKINA